jgi:hAT family C-terminal dimerisation region
MPIEFRNKIENIIYLHTPAAGELSTTFSQEGMYKEYTDFRIAALELKSTDPPSLAYRMIMERKISVLNFWLSRGDQWPALKNLACQIFQLVASSAASERNFSTFGFIHSKVRNCLKEDAVQKLVHIKTNNMQFTKQMEIEGELNCISDDESINGD